MYKRINKKYRIDKINELRGKGFTYTSIAKQLGITPVALAKFRKRIDDVKHPKQKLYAKSIPLCKENENVVAVGADGYMVSVGDGKNWVSVKSSKLRQAIAKAYNLELWLSS